jgi:hypothetical protein
MFQEYNGEKAVVVSPDSPLGCAFAGDYLACMEFAASNNDDPFPQTQWGFWQIKDLQDENLEDFLKKLSQEQDREDILKEIAEHIAEHEEVERWMMLVNEEMMKRIRERIKPQDQGCIEDPLFPVFPISPFPPDPLQPPCPPEPDSGLVDYYGLSIICVDSGAWITLILLPGN